MSVGIHHSDSSGCKKGRNYTVSSVCCDLLCLTLSLCSIGHLYSNTKRTVGILDLGGGSTQITFLPKSRVNEIFYVVNKSV